MFDSKFGHRSPQFKLPRDPRPVDQESVSTFDEGTISPFTINPPKTGGAPDQTNRQKDPRGNYASDGAAPSSAGGASTRADKDIASFRQAIAATAKGTLYPTGNRLSSGKSLTELQKDAGLSKGKPLTPWND